MSNNPIKSCPVCRYGAIFKVNEANTRAEVQCMAFPKCETKVSCAVDLSVKHPDAARLVLSYWDEIERPLVK